jgi:hypothetical protein
MTSSISPTFAVRRLAVTLSEEIRLSRIENITKLADSQHISDSLVNTKSYSSSLNGWPSCSVGRMNLSKAASARWKLIQPKRLPPTTLRREVLGICCALMVSEIGIPQGMLRTKTPSGRR